MVFILQIISVTFTLQNIWDTHADSQRGNSVYKMKEMKILILISHFTLKTTRKVSWTDIIVPILTMKKWNLREVK